MGLFINYKKDDFALNNLNFATLLDLGIELAERIATDQERPFLEVVKQQVEEGYYWPGRDLDIAEDFPTLDEQKFWARVFLELPRAIFDRFVGRHEHHFWQVHQISLALKLGGLFEIAVNDVEKGWIAQTKDAQEFRVYYINILQPPPHR